MLWSGDTGVNLWEPNSNIPIYPESCFHANPPTLVYDARRGVADIGGAHGVIGWEEQISGNANDYLVPPGGQTAPQGIPANSDFGGYPTVRSDGVADVLESANQAAATLLTSPYYTIVVHKRTGGVTLFNAANSVRMRTDTAVGFYRIYDSLTFTTAVAVDNTQAVWSGSWFNAAAGMLDLYKRDGTHLNSGIGNVGAGPPTRGVCMFARSSIFNAPGAFDIALAMVLPAQPSTLEILRFRIWLAARMGFAI